MKIHKLVSIAKRNATNYSYWNSIYAMIKSGFNAKDLNDVNLIKNRLRFCKNPKEIQKSLALIAVKNVRFPNSHGKFFVFDEADIFIRPHLYGNNKEFNQLTELCIESVRMTRRFNEIIKI